LEYEGNTDMIITVYSTTKLH